MYIYIHVYRICRKAGGWLLLALVSLYILLCVCVCIYIYIYIYIYVYRIGEKGKMLAPACSCLPLMKTHAAYVNWMCHAYESFMSSRTAHVSFASVLHPALLAIWLIHLVSIHV